jgi:hypothetical protein
VILSSWFPCDAFLACARGLLRSRLSSRARVRPVASGPALISRKGCSSAARGWRKSLSYASDPIPITHDRFPSMSRNPTARNSAGRSPQTDRIAARLASPGFTVATKKMRRDSGLEPPPAVRERETRIAQGTRSMKSVSLAGSISVGCPAMVPDLCGIAHEKRRRQFAQSAALLFDCYGRSPRRSVSDDSGIRISSVGNQFGHFCCAILTARHQQSA